MREKAREGRKRGEKERGRGSDKVNK